SFFLGINYDGSARLAASNAKERERVTNVAHRAAMLGLLGLTALTVLGQKNGMVKDQPWMNSNLSPERRADLVLEQMTLDEKIGMLHGNGMARQKHLPPEIEAVEDPPKGGAG